MCQSVVTGLISLLLVMSTVLPAHAAEEAGRVTYSRGEAWLVRGGERVPVTVGTAVHPGDVVVTEAEGRVRLSMVDKSLIYIGSHSRMTIRRYEIGNDNVVTAKLDLLWGKARFLVHKLAADRAAYGVHTSSATMGVRGTQFTTSIPKPVNIPKESGSRLPAGWRPAPQPTEMMLFEGAIEAINVKGERFAIRAGTHVRFEPNGRVITRPILPADIKALGIPRLVPEAVEQQEGDKPDMQKQPRSGRGQGKGPARKAEKGTRRTTASRAKAQPGGEGFSGRRADGLPTMTDRLASGRSAKAGSGDVLKRSGQPSSPQTTSGASGIRRNVAPNTSPTGTAASAKPARVGTLGATATGAGPPVSVTDASQLRGGAVPRSGVASSVAAKPQVSRPKPGGTSVAGPRVISRVVKLRISTPKVTTPKATAPRVSAPKVSAPRVSSPKVAAPKISRPKVRRLQKLRIKRPLVRKAGI